MLSSSKKKKAMQMSGFARIGISLLIIGALLAAFGQYNGREAVAIFGVVMVACGFVLYMAASIVAKRRAHV
ncbi:MAG: hypothetical protein QXX64_02840 [Nitrososphaera sp.]|uniref:hypothetical protein n=1 Tax=Candidatus Nitrososphaera gargensis TaxID=497727 RepID=UPI0011E556B2|nr:hypothetical protein [Candidatus Nitrososphaera gargensis]